MLAELYDYRLVHPSLCLSVPWVKVFRINPEFRIIMASLVSFQII